ncbi:nuclear pore complex subunit Nro1-domain-containing protein [Chlamydoabsidia padenii]|nr:nuclear pore complex subunit Nro1-domain-containing protein [Chlamydoabsidia padenii]
MAPEKKRPRGLKSSSASKKEAPKKAKTNAAVDEKDIPENAQTVMINKVVEEGDEVGEAAALLDEAIEKLEKSPSEVLSLLRGTIHESDRILRNWESDTPLPALFYYTYGTALYELGRLSEDEEFTPFLEAAEERIQDGFDHYKEKNSPDQDILNKMDLTLGKIWLAKAALSVDADSNDIPELALKALDTLDRACGLSSVTTSALLDIGAIVRNHGDLYSSLEHRNKFTQWADGIFERILKDDPNNARALSELGLSRLALANHWLERMDELDDTNQQEENKTERSNEEQKAYDAILEGKEGGGLKDLITNCY